MGIYYLIILFYLTINMSNHMAMVIPQLYIGTIQSAESLNHLKDTGITHIV